jgi:dienelactone hydrolase
MFEYFAQHYSWNLGVLMAVQLGGELSEIDEACRPLIEVAKRPGSRDDPEAQRLWAERWSALARKIEAKAKDDENAGHALSAGRKYRRAAVYFMTAERMASRAGGAKLALYRAFTDCFRKSVELRREPIEFVEVPFGETTLPALLYRAPAGGPRPAMIHFDGFDVTKEWMHLCGMAEAFAARGISTLMVDHPGVGAALRLQGLPTAPESERWASASLDYLGRRADIDAKRVGIIAMSLGGYFAPRAAAFEKRLACCIAWGARWDNALSHGRILEDPNAARSVSGWIEHALWVYGARDADEAAAKIAAMTLEGVAERIECPLLVVHGENDRQVPLEQARLTVERAVKARRRDLRVFTAAEGGAEHVQGDNFSLAVDYMADWAAEVLVEAPARGAAAPKPAPIQN